MARPLFDGFDCHTTQWYSHNAWGRKDDIVWFEFVESKVFSKQMGALPAEDLINIQSELVQNPQRGDIVKGTHGVRKARAADPGSSRGKSGSYRYLYL